MKSALARHLLFVLCSALALVATLGLGACGAQQEAGSIRIGTMPTEDILPMWVAEQEGLFDKAGVKAEIVVFDSAQSLSAALTAGEVDIAMTDPMRAVKLCESGTDLTLERITLGTTPDQGRFGVLTSADSGITSLADLAGKSVMAQAASSAVDAINENEDFKASLKEVVELGDYNMGFMDLAQGTVDAVAADLGVAQYQIANNDGDYVILDEPLSTEQYAIGFLKGNTELRDAVNAELLKMAEDGTMLEIAQKYVDQGLVLDSLCLINK